MRKLLLALVLIVLVPGGQANAAVITFSGLQAPSPFASYTESGFTVAPAAGDWMAWPGGSPGPAIAFINPNTQFTTSAEIEVTAGGALFTFQSVDLYSSVSPIPYVFRGFLNSSAVWNQSGTVPNTFGNFRTVFVNSSQPIDTLRITVVNPMSAGPFFGANPAGLDTIVVNQVAEPASVLLISAGLAIAVRRRVKRG